MQEIFGQDNFYLELQDHGIPEQAEVNRRPAAHPPGDGHPHGRAPTTPTTSARRTPRAHDILLCIQTGKTVDDENRMRYEPRNFYLRSDGGDGGAVSQPIRRRVENTQQDRRHVPAGV